MTDPLLLRAWSDVDLMRVNRDVKAFPRALETKDRVQNDGHNITTIHAIFAGRGLRLDLAFAQTYEGRPRSGSKRMQRFEREISGANLGHTGLHRRFLCVTVIFATYRNKMLVREGFEEGSQDSMRGRRTLP